MKSEIKITSNDYYVTEWSWGKNRDLGASVIKRVLFKDISVYLHAERKESLECLKTWKRRDT